MTPAIVLTAASIIEEELASGLGAAKRIEQRFLDVEKLRAQPPDALVSRLRRDAHDAVDILLDVIAAAATTVADRAGRFVNVTASHTPPMAATGGAPAAPAAAPAGTVQLPTVRLPGPVAPGSAAELVVSLENGSDAATAEFALHSSDLMGSAGQRIPAAQVSFEPATLAVPPRATGQVVVRVQVPPGTPPGAYEGLVRAAGLQALRAMLHVQVR